MDGDGGFKHRGARDVFPADVPQRRRSYLRWDAHSAHKAAGLRWCFLGAKGDPAGVCVRGGSKRMKMNRTWTSSTLVLSSFVWSCSYWYWNCGSFLILLSCTRICTMFPLLYGSSKNKNKNPKREVKKKVGVFHSVCMIERPRFLCNGRAATLEQRLRIWRPHPRPSLVSLA